MDKKLGNFSTEEMDRLLYSDAVVIDGKSAKGGVPYLMRISRRNASAGTEGCYLLFLPPYSQDFNPIEKFWAWLKRFLRKFLQSAASFDDALFTAF